tara:strand:- start:1379 stop:1591 length:213 start_codon:yes stop_codon:yes gene_type:complete
MVIHSWKDKQNSCIHCEASDISKLLTKPLKVEKNDQQKSVGNITKEYIDSNKQILKDLKKDSKSENYDPS